MQRHVQSFVPQDTPRGFQAMLTHDKQAGGVSQLVSVPDRYAGFDARSANSVIHGLGRECRPRLTLRILLGSVALARLYWGFSPGTLLLLDEPILFGGREKNRIGIGL